MGAVQDHHRRWSSQTPYPDAVSEICSSSSTFIKLTLSGSSAKLTLYLRRNRMVDYSRFDGIGDEEEEAGNKARVTVLEKASSIKISKDGWQVAPGGGSLQRREQQPRRVDQKEKHGVDYSRWDKIEDSEESDEEKMYYEDEYFKIREAEAKAKAAVEPRRASPRPRQPTDPTLDGSIGRRVDGAALFAWTQTAEEVTIRFALLNEPKVFFDRSERRCVLTIGTLRAIFKYDIWCEGDDRPHFRLADNDNHAEDLRFLDWEREEAPKTVLPGAHKCVKITIRKRPPTRDIVVWWSRVFDPSAQFVETDIDTAALSS